MKLACGIETCKFFYSVLIVDYFFVLYDNESRMIEIFLKKVCFI